MPSTRRNNRSALFRSETVWFTTTATSTWDWAIRFNRLRSTPVHRSSLQLRTATPLFPFRTGPTRSRACRPEIPLGGPTPLPVPEDPISDLSLRKLLFPEGDQPSTLPSPRASLVPKDRPSPRPAPVPP